MDEASTISLVLEHWSRANPGWRWRTVLADSDGLAIATQDTIHPPKILGKSKCMSNAIRAIRSGCASSARQLPACRMNCHLQLSCRAFAPHAVFARRISQDVLSPDQESLHALYMATLRMVQSVRPAMLATLCAGSTPVFGARSLASTSPRHVRNKT